MAETESGKKLREVLTDNARELSQEEIRRICEETGVKLNTTVPYHPASNGIAERTIGVLTNAICAMLHDADLPKDLWAEAYNSATYVRNRLLTSTIDGLTPYEMVYGVKPNLANLRAFGVPCTVVEPREKLRKLDDRASACVFVGYKYGGGGYRVWDCQRSVVVEARGVTFFEEGPSPPTLRQLTTPADDSHGHLTESLDSDEDPDDKPLCSPMPSATSTPATTAAPATTNNGVTTRPRLIIKLPRCYAGNVPVSSTPPPVHIPDYQA